VRNGWQPAWQAWSTVAAGGYALSAVWMMRGKDPIAGIVGIKGNS